MDTATVMSSRNGAFVYGSKLKLGERQQKEHTPLIKSTTLWIVTFPKEIAAEGILVGLHKNIFSLFCWIPPA